MFLRGRLFLPFTGVLQAENNSKDTTKKDRFDQVNFILFIINVFSGTNLRKLFTSFG